MNNELKFVVLLRLIFHKLYIFFITHLLSSIYYKKTLKRFIFYPINPLCPLSDVFIRFFYYTFIYLFDKAHCKIRKKEREKD
jgi:hypothetical protein